LGLGGGANLRDDVQTATLTRRLTAIFGDDHARMTRP
jgi:hypothetical protein